MHALMKAFPYDPSIVTDEAVAARLRVAEIPSGKETIRKLQPGADQEPKVPRIVKCNDELPNLHAGLLLVDFRSCHAVQSWQFSAAFEMMREGLPLAGFRS